MRNAAKKWQTRARKYLTLLATYPEVAKQYRLHFWKGGKFDRAVGEAKANPGPTPGAMLTGERRRLRTDGKAAVRRGDGAK